MLALIIHMFTKGQESAYSSFKKSFSLANMGSSEKNLVFIIPVFERFIWLEQQGTKIFPWQETVTDLWNFKIQTHYISSLCLVNFPIIY